MHDYGHGTHACRGLPLRPLWWGAQDLGAVLDRRCGMEDWYLRGAQPIRLVSRFQSRFNLPCFGFGALERTSTSDAE